MHRFPLIALSTETFPHLPPRPVPLLGAPDNLLPDMRQEPGDADHQRVPSLRLLKEQVDRDYAEINSRREVIRLLESPREKWRKRYGNFVREAEWALLELRKYYSQKQYEEIVIGTSVALSHETSGDFLKMMRAAWDRF